MNGESFTFDESLNFVLCRIELQIFKLKTNRSKFIKQHFRLFIVHISLRLCINNFIASNLDRNRDQTLQLIVFFLLSCSRQKRVKILMKKKPITCFMSCVEHLKFTQITLLRRRTVQTVHIKFIYNSIKSLSNIKITRSNRCFY